MVQAVRPELHRRPHYVHETVAAAAGDLDAEFLAYEIVVVEDAVAVGVLLIGGSVNEGKGSVGGEDHAEGGGGYGVGAGNVALK